MINEKKYSNLDIENNSKMMRDIIENTVLNEMEEAPDKYGLDPEIAKNYAFTFYLTHTEKEIWKGSKTKFTKVFEKELNSMVDNQELTFEEVGILTYIASKFINYEDNIIRVDNEYASKEMLINALKSVTKNSDSYFKRILSALEKKDVILSMKNPNNNRKKFTIYHLTFSIKDNTWIGLLRKSYLKC